MKLSSKDILQLQEKNISLNTLNHQIDTFKKGTKNICLKEAATIGNGIVLLTQSDRKYYESYYDKHNKKLKTIKFVPASGVATRMFKFLFEFLENYNLKTNTINSYINKNNANELAKFFIGLDKFPFYKNTLISAKQKVNNFTKLTIDEKKVEFIKTLLDSDRLNYKNYPKGLLPFHKYENYTSTAFKEHILETIDFTLPSKEVNLHFTISKQHQILFDKELRCIKSKLNDSTKINVSFSYQNETTDTIAVNKNNTPYRDENNNLTFRPSGHGALIENLNAIDADIIFIKNIDNVTIKMFRAEMITYKKILAGVLIELQQRIFGYLQNLENLDIKSTKITEIIDFATNKLYIIFNSDFVKYPKKTQVEYLTKKLNRPIRVCGMVKNEGEPGGGPFWVKDKNNEISLQIVESAQINTKDRTQYEILNNATHFNPVDIVCGTKNYKGNKFDLTKFTDPETAFISTKTIGSSTIKALELPGLWNGAMANWNTIFIEVPLSTFNPVKTVNDLLKPRHQLL